MDNLKFAYENNLDNKISQKEMLEQVNGKSDVQLEKVSDEVSIENGETEAEEKDLILFYELNNYLKDYPIKYTETPLLNSMFNRLCSNLKLRECDSVIVTGDDGCGKTSLIYYYTEMVIAGSINECTVLEISYLNFPNTTVDIINDLIIVAGCFVNKGITDLIFFFDDFHNFPGCLWTDYSTIVKQVVNAFDENVHIKFVVAANADYIYGNEDVSRSIIDASILYTISQEVIPEEIISVLEPRICELMEYHGIEAIESNVLFMIYSMESASANQNLLPYEVYLRYLDKIMANFSHNGENIISFNGIKDYYLAREYKGEYFKEAIKSRKDIAKHEAGHTLIALLLQEFLYFNCVTVIGIPNVGYGGLTEIVTNSNSGWQTKKNYIKFAAFYLAGRYSEGNMDSGARSDIEKTNNIVRNFILTTGLFDELGMEFYCSIDEYDNLSPKKKALVDKLTQKLIKKARKYAKKKLKEYKPFVKALTKKLYEELFLSREDVLKLWSEFK